MVVTARPMANVSQVAHDGLSNLRASVKRKKVRLFGRRSSESSWGYEDCEEPTGPRRLSSSTSYDADSDDGDPVRLRGPR